MELGDHISLIGFESLDPATLIVMKKMIGSLAKKLSEEQSFDKLTFTLENTEMTTTLLRGEDTFSAQASESNAFFSLSKSLEELKQKSSL